MKRGISLIAVLMFMLAATTASVVLYKWIGSENFASGSRLKQSEAYQASESGLDAVQAWLLYRAADVGGVLGDYLAQQPTKMPYHMNSANHNVLANFAGNSKQNFKVYLIGADITKTLYKLKFMSVGRGRDGSEVSQTAIFSVEGLYRTDVPIEMTVRKPQKTTYNEDFWGNMGTAHSIESMRMVMTQTNRQGNAGGMGLNKITIGRPGPDSAGYLVLDGDYYTNNGIKVYGDTYVTGSYDLCASGSDFITGDLYIGGAFHTFLTTGTFEVGGSAYFGNAVDPNVRNSSVTGCSGGLGGTINIRGNSTMMGPYLYWFGNGWLNFNIYSSLVMGPNSYIDLSRATASTFKVKQNVALTNFNHDDKPPPSSSNYWPTLGEETGFELCLNPTVTGSNGSYKDVASNFRFTTNSGNDSRVRSDCTPTPSQEVNWGANPLNGTYPPNVDPENRKNLLAKLQGGSSSRSCDNAPIKLNMDIFNMDIYNDPSPPSWVHNANNPRSCETQNGRLKLDQPWVNLDKELKDCWNKTSSANRKLIDGKEWLIVHLKNHQFQTTTGNNNVLCDLEGTGNKCRYIIIFDFGSQGNSWDEFLSLPPTGDNAEVMIYLPQGSPYIINLAGGVVPTSNAEMGDNGSYFIKGPYNYFIFSDGDIKQFNTTGNRRLTGNVFMNNCSIMNDPRTQGNPYFISRGNTEFVSELIRGILLENDGTGTPPPGTPEDNEIRESKDNYIIPLSPRLKVELESKNISKESEPQLPLGYTAPSVLVMPRVLRMPAAALTEQTPLNKYYKFLYLNGATKENNEPSTSTRDCRKVVKEGEAAVLLSATNPAEGVYICTFTNNDAKVSEFFVKIQNSEAIPDIEELPEPGTSSPAVISSSSESSSSSSEDESNLPSSSSSVPSSSSTPGSVSNCPYPTEWCNPTTAPYGNGTLPSIPYNSTRPNSLITGRSYYTIGDNSDEFPERCIFVTNIQNLGNHGKWYDSISTENNDGFARDNSNRNALGEKNGARYERYYPIRVNGEVLYNSAGGAYGGGRCGGNGQGWQSDLLSCDSAIKRTPYPNNPPSTSKTPGIPRVNGGYYVYLPPGWMMQNIELDGGVPSCPGVSSSSSSESSSSSSAEGGECVNFVNGNNINHCGKCYNAGLSNMGQNKCYKVVDARGCTHDYINNDASSTYWWEEAPCGESSSSSSGSPTVTCKLVDRNNNQVTSLAVTQGEDINAPAISCSSGDKDFTNFISPNGGHLPPNSNNWKTGGTTYYDNNVATGTYTIKASSVTCGSTDLGDRECGTITVAKPTCTGTGVSGNASVGQTITPIVSCGNAALGNRTFTASNWNNNNTTGGSFSSVPNPSSQNINLSSVHCDNHNITVSGVSCGSVTVQAERLFCDYGPLTEYGGGCFEIGDPCNSQYGQVVSVCGIDMTYATNTGWNKIFNAGTYNVTGSKSTCSIDCVDGACSLSGAINASGSSAGWINNQNHNVSNGQVTIIGKVKFNACW